HNKGHGIAVYSSDNDQLFTFGAFKNDLDGVFLGVNPDLPLAGPGLGNHLSNGSARDNGDYGVELDDTTAGNTVNQLTETGANNGADYDLIDENGDCDHNVWSNNLVDDGRGSPACVGQ
ncbi:MAG TPA: hypothetical protein VJN94_00430, partial [Candidatus Binataceae bacterium]|nr:hypothetical protein [Candidatus Binataceae bacterium]